MATLKTKINLWVRSEAFTYGALPVVPHYRLTTHNIKKIMAYAKNKGKSGFPNLSYSVWKHIACNKLLLPMDLAWMYFVTFDLLIERNAEERIDWDARFARCSCQQELEAVKSEMSVPTLRFIVFLHIQQLHKISLRSSLSASSVEWPLTARSAELDTRSSVSKGKGLDEHSHMTFILNHLQEILDLLVEPDSYNTSAADNSACLSLEAVQALGFLIAGSVDNNRTIKPLHDIAMMQQVHQKTGYSKVNVSTCRSNRGWKLRISRSFPIRNLQSWLQSHIAENPFGISTCITTGRRLSWPLSGDEREGRIDSKNGRIASNMMYVPKDTVKGNKMLIISQVCKQTIARTCATLHESSLKIHRCHYSYIYLLAPLRSVSIEKCRHSTIVLGAVETVVHVSNCKQLRVITACRRISVSASSMCQLYLLTPNRPLIYSGNERLLLAPYHTHYPQLEKHMAAVGLSSKPNMWNKPLYVGVDQQDDMPVCNIIEPKELFTFSIPFQMDGDTKAIPGGLPAEYERGLEQHERQVESWQKAVKEMKLTREQRKSFQAVVESTFQEWLAESGHKRELDDLTVSATGARRK